MIDKPKRMKHDYTDELELKSLIIRVNNRTKIENTARREIDNTTESVAKNALVNRYIKIFLKLKKYRSEYSSRKQKLISQRNTIKQIIIDLSVDATIDKVSYERFGNIILLMIKSILTKPNFANLGYDGEFYSNSVYTIAKYVHNFDHLKISKRSGLPGNAFAYISQYIMNSFLGICNDKRDEKLKLNKQINMELLDEKYQIKHIDLHIDDRERHHQEIKHIEEIVFIKEIKDSSNLVDNVKEILELNKVLFDNAHAIKIVYPECYRISFDEFNELKPLLDSKISINRFTRVTHQISHIDDDDTLQNIIKDTLYNEYKHAHEITFIYPHNYKICEVDCNELIELCNDDRVFLVRNGTDSDEQ